MQQGHALWQRVFKERGAAVSRRSRRRTLHRRAGAAAWSRTRRSSRSSSPTTCSATSSPTSARRSRAASGMAASGNLHPGQDVDVRAGARLGAAARREERRQPDRRDLVGGADARDLGLTTGSRGDRSGGAGGRRRAARARPTSAARSARARPATTSRHAYDEHGRDHEVTKTPRHEDHLFVCLRVFVSSWSP